MSSYRFILITYLSSTVLLNDAIFFQVKPSITLTHLWFASRESTRLCHIRNR